MNPSDVSRSMFYTFDLTANKTTRWGGKREGAGRPSEVQDPVRFTFDVERAEMKALKVIAESRGISVAKLVRGAVRAYLGRRERR